MRLALPKGKLLPALTKLLGSSGIDIQFKNDRDYKPHTDYLNLDVKLFKARSISQLVALGNFDIGFCGHDVFIETGYDEVKEIFSTNFNKVEIVVATPKSKENIVISPPKRPVLIATEYENIADRWAIKNNLAHITLQSRGSTEAYPPEDADIIIDCAETGQTLEANGLVVIEKLFETTTVLIANKFSLRDEQKKQEIKVLVDKLSKNL
jgi:ATP phosphoribosyltransferase